MEGLEAFTGPSSVASEIECDRASELLFEAYLLELRIEISKSRLYSTELLESSGNRSEFEKMLVAIVVFHGGVPGKLQKSITAFQCIASVDSRLVCLAGLATGVSTGPRTKT